MSRVLVLGAGVSGLAAARLAERLGMAVTVYDREESSQGIPHRTATGSWDAALLDGVDLVVASPGFSDRSLPIVESLDRGVPVWGEIEFAFRHLNSPVVAVTGTNGKTSVTEATSLILDASGLDAPATGNIGAPLSDFTTTSRDALVVEASSFQLRFVESFHPAAAAITNLSIDHLDWHGSEVSYREAKARIFMNQTDGDLLVFGADDPGATELAASAPGDAVAVSGVDLPGGGAGVKDGRLVVGDASVDVSDLTSDHPTHLANLAAAGTLAMFMGATPDGFVEAAARYTSGKHRRTIVGRSGGVTWVNDSKATNPHAALASIGSFESVVLIAGGLAKGLDLGAVAQAPNISLVLGIGEAGPELVETAGERGRLAGTIESAVDMALQASAPGDTVLLAPACASLDQFESYRARGDRFTELALEAIEGGRP